ncbi:MAG: DUF4013 domain-containing protein [Ignavibacteriota bacterium]|nr:MAG: hypothetical protein EDM72_12035 [Chlorobiota bacterium]MBE7477363.1 DUF4013 domain-containing protein [Ignavibacteriales bacterium]MBL1122764.1 hypothetical protein [Ignavibacteriota bacterium]MCC7094518.1 DUF4013 domain-containing protein [Ignavibacteriaceae bacterium]MCE7857592.1 hypothetical protein [Ignavibacteria bacterium CHB3]
MPKTDLSNEVKIEEGKGKSIFFITLILVIGVVIIFIYSIAHGADKFLSILSISAIIALTSAIVGAFIGFIFGIPRTPAAKDSENIGANTNLEEISDWITKIIVGVSLVQLNQLSDGIYKIGNTLSQGMGGQPSSFVFSVSTMIFYFVGGFFLGYLWSRIYLPKILLTSMEEGYRRKIKEKEDELMETQSLVDDKNINIDIRKEVESLLLQSDPKNYKDFKGEDFTKDKLQTLINKIIDKFENNDAQILFGQIIIALYNIRNYNLINELADQYKKDIDISYSTWTDIALANMNLYNTNRDKEYYKRMNEAIVNTRKSISDYGVTYAIELYFELIDLTIAIQDKDEKIKSRAEENIQSILDELKLKPDVAAFEAINYMNKNEVIPRWMDYNKLLRDNFAEAYNQIDKKSKTYKESNPDQTKYYQTEA